MVSSKENAIALEMAQGRNLYLNFSDFMRKIPGWVEPHDCIDSGSDYPVAKLDAVQLLLALLDDWVDEHFNSEERDRSSIETIAQTALISAVQVLVRAGASTEEIVDLLEIDNDFVDKVRQLKR